MCIVSDVPAVRGESGISISFACEQYAMNLPAIEEYIGHSIPVSQYDPNALLQDIPKPYRIKRATSTHRISNNNRRKPFKVSDKPVIKIGVDFIQC